MGRALEVRQFMAVLDACRDGGYGGAMLIRGEPGIGKTRLLEEYLLLARREGFAVHRGQAYDFGTARGRDALSQIARSLLGASAGDPAAMGAVVGEGRLPYLQGVLGLEPEPGQAEQMASLSPYERLDRSADAVAELLRETARRSALVVVADDLHWADRLTLAVLPRLARAAAELPVAVLMTSRVAGEALDPQWRAAMGGAPLLTLDLQPLRPPDASRLASAFGVQERARERLLERAAGNPLFIEQLARSGRLGQDLPYSIQGLAVAQLEALPEPVQAGLCAASVLGQFFTPAAVAATAGGPPDLEAALEAGLIARGESEWHFHHALIRDGIYQNVLPSERRHLHRRAAEYYRLSSLTLHAQHLDLAGAEHAGAALVAAAADEIEHYRLARARDLVRRALERSPEDTGALLLDAQLELMLGNTARAAALFRTCRSLAWEDSVRARSLVGLGMALNQLDRHADAMEALEAATRLKPDDHGYQADAWLQLGNALFPQGRTEQTLRAHQTALNHAERAGSTLSQARAEGGLGDAYYQQGAMLTAYAHFDRCVQLGKAHDHPSVVPANQAMRALTLMYHNQLRDALADGDAALMAARASSNVRHQLLAHNVLASLQSFHGDSESGVHHAERTLALGQRIGSRRFVVDARAQLVHLLWGAGRWDEARQALQAVEASLDASLMPFAGAYVRGLQAVCATSAGERRRFLEDGRQLLGGEALSHCHLFFYVAAMEACLVAGETRQALDYADGLATYTAAEPLPWADFFIRVTQAVAHGAAAEERGALRLEAEQAGLGVGMRLL
jgi:tetratricopeptide (TPR) repeat protein